MLYTTGELRQKIFGNIYDVYEIFQNFFGEPFVDLQDVPDDTDMRLFLQNYDCPHSSDDEWDISDANYNRIREQWSILYPVIYVWWPRVTITNENGRSIKIQDLYAKIRVTLEGKIPYEDFGFQLTRTTFPNVQFACGYIHSHVPRHREGVPYFQNPCYGQGPIRNTVLDLKNSYEEALWMLFCQELSLYVTVESLQGIPYFKMEDVGSGGLVSGYTHFSDDYQTIESLHFLYRYNEGKKRHLMETLRYFTSYYLEHGHLSVSYQSGAFVTGMSYFDYMIDVSNAFISYHNEVIAPSEEVEVNNYFDKGILKKVLAANNRFYEIDEETEHNFSDYEGEPVLTFKGEEKRLHIQQAENVRREPTILLNHSIAMYLLYNILKVINYRYKNEHNNNTNEGTSSSKTYQTVVYL